jgi:TRAP transporter TAXI family solute receptor
MNEEETHMRKAMISIAVSAVAAAGIAAGAVAAEVKLPKNLSWTAYGTTSSGYAQSVGLGNMLKAKYGTEVRIIPGKNDVSRMLPLKAGQAELCACGIAAYFSAEGVLMFADEKWGPQPLRNLFNNNGRHGTVSAAIADDVGVKSVKDLKGKRVAWVKGSPALQTNMTAILAYGGLTWNDVVKVEVPGWGQSMQAVLDGQADAAMGSSISAIYNQIAASPRGLFVPNFPHDDKEAWARMHKVAPYVAKAKVSLAINGENNPTGKLPYEGAGYAYPIFVSLAPVSDDVAYGLTKAVMDNYASFKDAGPGMDGYKVESQNFQWAFPYHAGAIQYYKEAGVWTAEDQAHTDMLLKREMILANAWKKTKSEGFSSAKWLANRSAALKAAGMDAPFSE